MTDIQKGDYISFTTVVQPAVKASHKGAGGKKFEYVVTEARWIEQPGSGIVLKVNKTKKRLPPSFDFSSMHDHMTARVDAGPWLGVLTVSIDDAVLVGVQDALDVGAAQESFESMYSTTGDGA